MKRISILLTTVGFAYIGYASASFEPLQINLIVDKDTLPYKQETDDAIRDFIHFFFVKEKKGFVSCYALVALKANDYLNPIGIIKGEPYTTLKKWEYIPLPRGVNGVNLKYIGLLDDRLTLITQERTTFGNNYYSCIYQYDPFKKSALNFLSPIALENPGWNKLYETSSNTTLSKFTGNTSQSWWIYTKREYPNTDLVSHVYKDKNSMKIGAATDALWITTTPDNLYLWTIKPMPNNPSRFTLLIEDLEDTDEFKEATLIELSNNMPHHIKNLIAFDGSHAYCVDNSGNLYEIKNNGEVTLIATEIGAINNIGYLNDDLVVGRENKLYIYKPKKPALKAQIIKTIKTPPHTKEKSSESQTEAITTTAPANVPEKTNASQPNVRSTESSVPSAIVIPATVQPNTAARTTTEFDVFKKTWDKAKKQALIQSNGKIVPFSGTTQEDDKKTGGRIPFNTKNQSHFMKIIQGPFLQSMLKRTLGGDSYFYKILKKKNPVDVEREALINDPKPWGKFIPKPTRYEDAQYWLFKKTGGWLGNDSAEKYSDNAEPEFPTTKEGRRAKLLYALSTNNPNYITQWLNKTEWDKLDITAKARLRSANEGVLPEFREFWLQERIQDVIKKLPSSVEELFADED